MMMMIKSLLLNLDRIHFDICRGGARVVRQREINVLFLN
jgi:hypothetical protein